MSMNGIDLTCSWNVNSVTQTVVSYSGKETEGISFCYLTLVCGARKAPLSKALIAGNVAP